MVGAYDQRCVPSGVRDRQLDWLDKSPTFIRYPANWQREARLLHRVPILANRQDRRSSAKDAGRSYDSFYDLTSVHTRQEIPSRTNRGQSIDTSVRDTQLDRKGTKTSESCRIC